MTTIEGHPVLSARFQRGTATPRRTRRQRLGAWTKARRVALQNRRRVATARTRTLVRAWRSGVLITSGFGSLSASAWVAFGLAAGLAAIGVSLIVLELLTGKGP